MSGPCRRTCGAIAWQVTELCFRALIHIDNIAAECLWGKEMQMLCAGANPGDIASHMTVRNQLARSKLGMLAT